MNQDYKTLIRNEAVSMAFSGACLLKSNDGVLKDAFSFRNKENKIKNDINTKFPVASGCKIYTAVAVCMLVDSGKLAFNTRIKECLNNQYPYFDESVTIHQLLTHTSCIPDYFDEDIDSDFEDLWKEYPVYEMRTLSDFLPLFQKKPVDRVSENVFKYNNAGYIMLGLVVESLSGMRFTDFVEEYIFKAAGMHDSGYFELDALPGNTADCYIRTSNSWKKNIYSVPVKGGADGGAYTTVSDRMRFFKTLTDGKLLSENILAAFFKPQVIVDQDDYISYGYCGYMETDADQKPVKYIQMGYDPGVNFREVFYPLNKNHIVVCSNEEDNAYELLKVIETRCLNV